MLKPETLDDNFVITQLLGVATRWPALYPFSSGGPGSPTRHDDSIEDCQRLFRNHRGISLTGHIPLEHLSEWRLLNLGLDILCKVLSLYRLTPVFKQVIDIDWKAHTGLTKEKRYRDHITHPVRVTAVGWWLLHLNGDSLLKDLAAFYERQTEEYRRIHKVISCPHTWKAIIEYAWLACGLLHDTAYPLEYHLRSGETLRCGYGDTLRLFDPVRRRFSTHRGRLALLKKLNNSWLDTCNLDLHARMEKLAISDGFKHAHALIGSLHNLLGLKTDIHSLQGLIVQLACRAIISHHDDEDRDILSDPLALLLYVSDNLQTWQRQFLHREENENPPKIGQMIRPIVECERIILVPDGSGYRAVFQMNVNEMAILAAAPYNWRLDQFRKPNQKVERLLLGHRCLPPIILSQPQCIGPEEFLKFMEEEGI